MNARTRKVGLLALLVVAAAALIGWAQVHPQGLIVGPSPSDELIVSISTDKSEYQVGELVTISYEVSKAAYIYIWDILPTGEVQVVFPNDYYSWGQDNFVEAGEHQLPQSFPVAPPYGTEYLQILATTQPIDISAFPMSDPALFQEQVEVQALGLLLEDEKAWSFTSFEILEEVPDDQATLIISSTPSDAEIRIDGTYVGNTPGTHYVAQGAHTIQIAKAGYVPYSTFLILFGTGTREINAELDPLFPTNDPPTAAFTFDPPNPLIGSYVQFNASGSSDSDGSIVSYSWNFGDGTTGSGPVIWHLFSIGGSIPVTLAVTDDDGASDSVTHAVPVGAMNTPPVAAFTTTVATGGWVQFDASAAYDTDGSIVSYMWSFGDGNTGTGSVVWHQYLSSGPFLATLTVVDDDGASASASETVILAPSNTPPVASFTFTSIGSNWVRFDATASSDADGSIVSYGWNFGDGSSGTGSVTYHQFPTAGVFLVVLTVTDNGGATATESQVVDLGPAQEPPVASFTYSPLFPQVGQLLTLDGTSSFDPDGTIVSYQWDLNGDGIYDAFGPITQGTFGTAGARLIRLAVTDNDGLTASATQTIYISASSGPAGAPAMGTTPGFFVWGTDRWHITVNAGAGWVTPHSYEIELRTDGTFEDINDPSGTPVIPLGLTPTPVGGGWTVTFSGSILSGSVDYTFRVPTSDSVWMRLRLDYDGDGDLEESTSFIYLGNGLVNPPNVPMVVGLPRGSTAELLPTIDYRVGSAARYTETSRWIFWRAYLSDL